MSTKAVFTMKLEPELRATFMAETAAADRPASQVVRELMREYIDERKQAREYDAWFCREVEAGIAEANAGDLIPAEEVEVEASAWRVETLRKIAGHAV